MSEKYTPANGDPVDMSQVTLGPRYGSEDMYREAGLVSFVKDGVVYTDYVDAVKRDDPVTRTQAMLADILKTVERLAFTRRQRIWRRIRQIIQR
jgi:hypothetical protein